MLAGQEGSEFDGQWVRHMSNSYDVVQNMRIVPFALRTARLLALCAVAPLVPLAFAVLAPVDVMKGLL